MASSTINDSCPFPSVRVIVQQCLSARLQVQPPSNDKEAEWVEGATLDLIPKVVKSILNVRLSEISSGRGSNVSVLELPGDVLIVPQATLGGKMKGKAVQYHSNTSKEEGKTLYDSFVLLCEEKLTGGSTSLSDNTRVRHGTYGNRQVLSVVTNGPFTHVFDF